MIYKKIPLFLLQFCFTFSLFSQISENFTLEYNWVGDSIPNVGGVIYNDIWGLTDCDAQEYAIMGSTEFIHVFKMDVYEEVGRVAGGSLSLWRDLKTYDEVVYGVADQGQEGLSIIDLRNLSSMIENGDTLKIDKQLQDEFTRAHNIFIDQANSRLYVAGSNTQNDGLIVYDLFDDPLNPKLVAMIPLMGGGYVHDLYVRDNIAYCSHGANGYYIWDMSDPKIPVLLANTITNGYNHSSWLSEDGNYAFVAEETSGLPMLVIDVSDKDNGNIEIVNSFSEPLLSPVHLNNVAHNPFVRGNKLYVSYYEDGVQVFDVNDPINPSRMAYYDTNPNNVAYSGTNGNWGVFPFFPSGKVIASDDLFGLFVLAPDFEFSPMDHIPITNTITLINYNCDDMTYSFNAQEGYLDYTLYESDTIFYRGPKNEFVVPAGEYSLFLNNGDCTNTSAEVMSNTFFLSPKPDPLGEISSDGLEFCEFETATISLSANVSFVRWYKDGQEIMATENLLSIEVMESGEYSAEIFVNDPSGFGIDHVGDCSEELNRLNLTFFEVEPIAIFESDGLLSTGTNTAYQWYLNGQAIPGAIDQFHQALEDGDYYVIAIDDNGCSVQSETLSIVLTSVLDLNPVFKISAYPNPVADVLHLNSKEGFAHDQKFEIYAISGEKIGIINSIHQNANEWQFNFSRLDKGVYFIFTEGLEPIRIVKL